MTCDLLVLGGGPGGMDAALEGARLGLKTVLVEQDLIGGTCLNWGCIPTKLLLGATAAIPELRAQARLKLLKGPPRVDIDMAALFRRSRAYIAGTRKAAADRLAKAGIEIVLGRGEIESPGRLKVLSGEEERIIGYSNLVLAPGSRPAVFPGLEPDGDRILDSNQLLELETRLESLIVVGGGAVGLELAEFHHRLGAKITIVEAMDQLVPSEDRDIAQTLARILKREGFEIITGQRVASFRSESGQARLELESGRVVEADKGLAAIGRRPNSQGIGLEKLGIDLAGPGWIKTDDRLTAAPRVFAVGDANGRILLAHAASDQGRWAARSAAGIEQGPYSPPPVPACVYGSCEVMRVGANEKELEKQGLDYQISKSMLAANPIAQAHGSAQGFVKVVWREGRVAGISAVGSGVSQLAAQAGMIVSYQWKADSPYRVIFPHPSLDEALAAALAAPQS